MEKGLYYNRPACELIFLTEEEHVRLHHSGNRNNYFGTGPFKGHKHSKASKNKMSIARKKLVGSKNPFFGKHHTAECKARISQSHKMNLTEDIRRKKSEATKGRIWINNGKVNHRVHPDNIPAGFVKGRLP